MIHGTLCTIFINMICIMILRRYLLVLLVQSFPHSSPEVVVQRLGRPSLHLDRLLT